VNTHVSQWVLFHVWCASMPGGSLPPSIRALSFWRPGCRPADVLLAPYTFVGMTGPDVDHNPSCEACQVLLDEARDSAKVWNAEGDQ